MEAVPGVDLLRPSRDGDQFHYHWAARWCLKLLPATSSLVAVTVEGASLLEASDVARNTHSAGISELAVEAGEELIDVGLYFGEENRRVASRILLNCTEI